MKKLIIASTIALVAFASQAAQVKWVTSGNLTGVDVSAVGDNGNYAAGGANLKNNSSITFSLLVYAAGTDTLVDSLNSASVKYATGKSSVAYTWADSANSLAQGTTYDYKLIITGTQADLRALGVTGGYDYSAAMITGETTGTFTTEAAGQTQVTADISSWTVSGVTAVTPPTPVPEPTSGLLLLLGVAGLALRRRVK